MRTDTTANIIKELTVALCGCAPDPRQRYLLSQALHGLVRLAKTEQMLEVRRDVETAAGASSGRQTKAILRKISMACDARQGQFEFESAEGARCG